MIHLITDLMDPDDERVLRTLDDLVGSEEADVIMRIFGEVGVEPQWTVNMEGHLDYFPMTRRVPVGRAFAVPGACTGHLAERLGKKGMFCGDVCLCATFVSVHDVDVVSARLRVALGVCNLCLCRDEPLLLGKTGSRSLVRWPSLRGLFRRVRDAVGIKRSALRLVR